MTQNITTLRARVQKHLAYRRTANELRNLPREIAEDLNIDRFDADRIAARAVYGA